MSQARSTLFSRGAVTIAFMDNDDEFIGRMLTRKEMLRLLGGAGALALAAGCGSGGSSDTVATTTTTTPVTTSASPLAATSPVAAASPLAVASPSPLAAISPLASPSPGASPIASPIPNVVITPAVTEGPYFVDENLNRSNVLGDTTRATVVNGLPLRLSFRVQRVSGATITPFAGAQVDLWQCDAGGNYSDIASEGTTGQNWLRGYQLADANGLVAFTTIYPGWYQGRTIHLHLKIRSGSFVINTQLFFDETVSDQVMANAPYNTRGNRTTRNSNDGIYLQNNVGSQLMLTMTRDADNGITGTFTFGVQA